MFCLKEPSFQEGTRNVELAYLDMARAASFFNPPRSHEPDALQQFSSCLHLLLGHGSGTQNRLDHLGSMKRLTRRDSSVGRGSIKRAEPLLQIVQGIHSWTMFGNFQLCRTLEEELAVAALSGCRLGLPLLVKSHVPRRFNHQGVHGDSCFD